MVKKSSLRIEHKKSLLVKISTTKGISNFCRSTLVPKSLIEDISAAKASETRKYLFLFGGLSERPEWKKISCIYLVFTTYFFQIFHSEGKTIKKLKSPFLTHFYSLLSETTSDKKITLCIRCLIIITDPSQRVFTKVYRYW